MKNNALNLLVLIALSGTALSANAAYTFNNIGNFGFGQSSATGINNLGQVVGNIYDAGIARAYVYSNGVTSELASLGGINSYAYAINDLGQVAGNSNAISYGPQQFATIWNGTTPTNLGTGGGAGGLPYAINNSGQVAGFTLLSDGSAANATVWNGSIATQLSNLGTLSYSKVGGGSIAWGINDASQVVGHTVVTFNNPNNIFHAAMWQSGNLIDLGTLGGNNSSALAINNSGVAVGWSDVSNSLGQHAALWNGLSIVDLGADLGLYSRASDINNLGVIVGSSSYGATMWSDTKAINLNSFLDDDVTNAGWILGSATGINDYGWIVGDAYNTKLGISSAYLLAVTPVPEPETYGMMLLGIAMLGFMARRRNNSAV